MVAGEIGEATVNLLYAEESSVCLQRVGPLHYG
jgi:hypothetical protein